MALSPGYFGADYANGPSQLFFGNEEVKNIQPLDPDTVTLANQMAISAMSSMGLPSALAAGSLDLSQAMALSFGVPVRKTKMCVRVVKIQKRWRRRGLRPDKVRVREKTIPGIMLVRDPFTQSPYIVCHPELLEKVTRKAV